MPDHPCLLALDTATETQHLALLDGAALQVRALPGGPQASATLLPALQALLAAAGCDWADLDAIAWGRGPGAFTGLRTASAVAQGLALGVGCPLLALDTLAAVAEHAAQQAEALGEAAPAAVWALTDARMGEIYAARWQRRGPGDWQADGAVALYAPAELVAAIAAAPADLAGPALRVHAAALQPALAAAEVGGRGLWPDAEPAGTALAALARTAWARGEAGDPGQPAVALPLYVRDKVAQTTAEREQARGLARAGTPAAAA